MYSDMMHMELAQPITGSCGQVAQRYSIYGLSVHSDVAFPGAPVLSPMSAAPDVVVTRHEPWCGVSLDGAVVAELSCPVHGTYMREYRNSGGVRIWFRSIGVFHVAPDTARVDVYPEAQVDERMLGLALGGPVLLFIRNRRGSPSLHASAVITEHGAIAFLGAQGRGKSTIAASFLRRGAALLTDDALPLLALDDGIYGVQGPPLMKVWRETARCALEVIDELPNLTAYSDKRLFTLGEQHRHALTPAHLRAFYVLNRYDPVAVGCTDVTFQTLGRRDALFTLMAHTSNRSYLLPADEAPFLPLYARAVSQAPVRVLTYPHGFAYQDVVHARIRADLEAL